MSDTKQEIKLSRSEAREQAFMLLFSRSFVQEPLEDTLADACLRAASATMQEWS